jgi:hypothetical protein
MKKVFYPFHVFFFQNCIKIKIILNNDYLNAPVAKEKDLDLWNVFNNKIKF